MYYSVKTLLSLGKNVSQIARELKIDRKTVRKIKKKVVQCPKTLHLVGARKWGGGDILLNIDQQCNIIYAI